MLARISCYSMNGTLHLGPALFCSPVRVKQMASHPEGQAERERRETTIMRAQTLVTYHTTRRVAGCRSAVRRRAGRVKKILAENDVRPDEAEKVKSRIRETGRFRIIDRVLR